MSKGADIQALTRVGLFAGIDWPELEAIAHGFDEELFPEGQRILRRGLGGSGLYLILEGEAAVTLNGHRLALLGRGEFFGEVSSLLGGDPTADVVATTSLRCLIVPRPEVEAFLLEHPRVMLAMLRAEALRLSNVLEWKG